MHHLETNRYATRVAAAALVLVALPTLSTVAAPQAVTLRWGFDEGRHLVYRMTMSQETEMPSDTGVMVAENAMTMSWDVLAVNDAGEATVRVVTERVQMNVQSPMGNIVADSAEPSQATDPIARTAMALAGMGYTMVFDASGQVREVLDLEEMRERLREAVGQPGNPVTDQLLDQMASEDGIRNMLGRGMGWLPPEPLQIGDSWDASFDLEIPMFGTMANTSIMTLESIESRDGDRIAVIDMSGDMIFTPEESSGGQMAGALRMGDASMSGDMEWNVDRGMLVRSSARTTMEMEITAGSQQMRLVMVMDQRMELVEDG